MGEFQLQKALCYLNYNASEDVRGDCRAQLLSLLQVFLENDFSTKAKINTILVSRYSTRQTKDQTIGYKILANFPLKSYFFVTVDPASRAKITFIT